MKVIEVSSSASIDKYLVNYSYMNIELIHYKDLNDDIFRKENSFDSEDIGCVVFIDQFNLNYLKYVTIKRLLGVIDRQIIWISTMDKEFEQPKELYSFERIILNVNDELGFSYQFMNCYHHFMQDKLNMAAQQTIRKTMRSMLGFLGEGILILDSKENIIFFNKRAEEISGYTVNEAMNKAFNTIMPCVNGHTKDPINNVFESLLPEKPSTGLPDNTMIIDKFGNHKYVSANISFLYKSLLKGYFVIIRDITKIKKTENDFRKLSKAVEYSPTSVVMTRLDGSIEYVNPYFIELTGYSFEEVEGKNPNILKSGYTSKSEYKKLWATISQGGVWKGVFQNKKKSGELYWERVFMGPVYDDYGVIVQYVAVKQEITKEVNMSRQMESERNLFYQLIESAPIGLILYNSKEGYIKINTRANQLLLDMNLKLDEPVPFATRDKSMTFIDVLEKVINNEQSLHRLELNFSDQNGNEYWIRVGAVPFMFKGVNHALLAVDDITENKKLEKQLEIARDEAKEADKAKSMFLANMSHEIRTPINGIIGLTEITLTNSNLDNEDEANLRMVQYSSRNLLKIINDILDISKLDAGKIEVERINFNLERVLFNIRKVFESKAKAKELEFDIINNNNPQVMLLGDPFRLQQILNNLINNAIKFTSEGEVKVIVDVSKEKRLNKMGQEVDFVDVSFTVKDTGIGISNKEKQCLFRRFSQVDSTITRQFGGTGLGLAITKSLVELLEGSIEVESSKGEGSTFIVNIGFEESVDIQKDEDEDVTIEIDEEIGFDILVVEDDRINQKIITSFINSYSKSLDLAVDGNQAVELAKRKRYDIIFMDIQLPNKDGVTAMDEIRVIYEEHDRYTPIIAVTANALKDDRDKFLYKGFDYYISKPYTKEDLIISISKLMSEDYLRMKKKYYENSIPELYQTLIDQLNKAKIYFEEDKYQSTTSCLGKIREISKGLSLKRLATLCMKLQLDIRKENYESFDVKYSEIAETIIRTNMEVW